MSNLNFESLTHKIAEAHYFFQKQVVRQVNTTLSLRNWLLGYYLVEYEQQGADRASYGEKLYRSVSKSLREKGLVGMSFTNLHLFKQFYLTYPQIVQAVSEQFKIRITISKKDVQPSSLSPDIETLLSKLTFSHFIELLKADSALKRAFYEVECLKNNWSVRDLQRAMDSLLYERTGLSLDKKEIVEAHGGATIPSPAQLVRDPYILEFLELPELTQFSEVKLETSIINNLQTFLIEAGRGFCFEARQKRITFDNTHYKIDLVFYHRILKCHVLIDLKIGEFTHADAGQMNVYLNYYKEEEMTEGDNPPIGIILCSTKNDTLVRYATGNLPQQIFVSKYLINLPNEEEIKKIIAKHS
ncbi:PDDEXK nuclease domain-containing protein [Runella limosa]|uniref:PDDEXK nuclease domain-containing protein n=1 Tax=Runella limosa TaxID=370978 RepID=UPI00041D0100|nr:PDDEXK nuclease domain-containing protein [Runella limosa]